jgi:hypothetical protein
MNHFRKPFACVVCALLMLVAAAAANADTIYTYTGNDYGINPFLPFTEHITATFTFATPLAGSLPLANDLPSLLSWTINVGLPSLSLSSTDSSDSMFELELGTGPSGAITAWDFWANGPDSEVVMSFSEAVDGDSVNSQAVGPVFANPNPDGWTSTTTTPEPSTLVSMALGVAVMLFAVRRRTRLAARA